MTRFQQQRSLQVLLDDVNLPLIVDVLQQLASIMGYKNTCTCCNLKLSDQMQLAKKKG